MRIESEPHEQGLIAVLRMVAERLDAAGVVWVVFAGAAATVYGSSRSLTDVDILVSVSNGERAAALFPEGEAIRQPGRTLGIKLPDCDLVAGLSVTDLDGEMAARITRHKLHGLSVPIIPLEDNLLLKGLWGRGAEQGKHDWADVEAMLDSARELDWEYLEWRAGAMAVAPQISAVLKRLRELWSRRGRNPEEPQGHGPAAT